MLGKCASTSSTATFSFFLVTTHHEAALQTAFFYHFRPLIISLTALVAPRHSLPGSRLSLSVLEAREVNSNLRSIAGWLFWSILEELRASPLSFDWCRPCSVTIASPYPTNKYCLSCRTATRHSLAQQLRTTLFLDSGLLGSAPISFVPRSVLQPKLEFVSNTTAPAEIF
jgi:hypothetical protein